MGQRLEMQLPLVNVYRRPGIVLMLGMAKPCLERRDLVSESIDTMQRILKSPNITGIVEVFS